MLCAFFVMAGCLAFAQTNAGSIVGTVRDPSGAVVSGAVVNVINDATNVNMRFTTNADGEYQALQLIPGVYSVQATHAGYSVAIRKNVVIDVQSRAQVDFALALGSVKQQVLVSASSPLLETQSAEVGGVLSTNTINDLPLNGRDYDQLALLEPGIYHMPNVEESHPAEGRFSANGNLELQNYYQLDGIDNNTSSENLQEATVQAVIPPPDALQEVVVQTRTYSTEFGTSAGAVVNASTKSGTNHFHGDAWDYVENSAFDANTYFNNYGGLPKGHFSQNQFGGTVGGPILRNRTFFFVSFETLLSSQAVTETSTVPTPDMKTGDFSVVSSTHPMTALASNQIGCITNNVISPTCIDPVGQALINLYPDPSPQLSPDGNINAFNGSANYEFVTRVPYDTKTLDTRIDHTLNKKNQISGRYAFDRSTWQSPLNAPNPIAGNEAAAQNILHNQSLSLGWNYAKSSSLLNTAHFGFLREFSHELPLDLPLGVSDASQFGLTGIPAGPYDAGIPPVYISDLTNLGTKDYRPGYQVIQVFQFVDDLYKLIGKHSLQFGYEYHENSLNFLDIEAPQGTITSNGIYSNTSGFGAADFLLGDVEGTIFDTGDLEVNNYMRGNSVYGQDTWRVTPNLTINYGLRYELYPPFWLNRENRTSNFSPANGGEIVTATGNNGLYGRVLMHPDNTDFSPRGGFAYHVARPLVLRGGFGIFHQFINRIGSESMLQLNPPQLLNDSISQSQGSTTPVFQLKNGYPAQELIAQGVSLPSLQIRAQDPDNRTAYVEQASFGPQIQLSSNTVLNLTYVGNWGRKENRLRNDNQGQLSGYSGTSPLISFPYANLNTEGVAAPVVDGAGTHAFLEVATNDGNLDFNALEVDLKRHLSHRLMYQISYTWSHGMADYADNLTESSTPQNAYDYGHEMSNSEQDTRHRFVASGSWVLPIGQGGWVLNSNSKTARFLGNWQVNAIVALQTGIPVTITAPDESDTGGNHASYPNCVGNPHTGASTNPKEYAGSNSPGFFLNVAAFSTPALGDFGTCRPRDFYGPGLTEPDISLFKSFPVTASTSFEFRAEFFNAFNHPSFENPATSISSPGAFGKSTNTTTNPRYIQFSGKFFF
jgi:hypothetical protein